MTRKRSKSLRCPICRTLVLKSEPEFPFCSERCRTTDLGKWASGAYRVAGPALDTDSSEELRESENNPGPDDSDETIH